MHFRIGIIIGRKLLNQMDQSKKVVFFPQDKRCLDGTIAPPETSAKSIPQWYKDANKYELYAGKPASLEEVKKGLGHPTYKNCVSVFDSLSAGYIYVTPCDVEFSIDDMGKPIAKPERGYEEFVGYRGPTSGYVSGPEYSVHHFHWVPSWAISTPEGYSCLYVHPLNREDLPFRTISGIIDNDNVVMTGQYPFLIKEGYCGIIPKGTPIAQLIPIKRENWESEVQQMSKIDIELHRTKMPYRYRKAKVNYYRDNNWVRKKYS